jgi:hypothetical protein
VTKRTRASNRPRTRSNVGVSLTANIVGTILKQAGLSESVSVQHERKVRKEPTPSGWALMMRAIK